MKRAKNFKFPMLELGDLLYQSDELQRWNALDYNMRAVAEACGDGVITGFVVTAESGAITVGPGSVLLAGVYAETLDTTVMAAAPETTYAVYAALVDDALIVAMTADPLTTDQIALALVTETTVDITNRTTVTFGGAVKAAALHYIRTHRHNGTVAPLVDLVQDVTGILNSAHIKSVNASEISGQLDPVNLPVISHVGRVHEACLRIMIPAYTYDYLDYFVTPWSGAALVYVDGIITTPSVVRADLGKITFDTLQQPTSLITVITDPTVFQVTGGAWTTTEAVTVYINGTQQDANAYATDSTAGTITFTVAPDFNAVVTITIPGTYVLDTGINTHPEIDDALSVQDYGLARHMSAIDTYNQLQQLQALDRYATTTLDDPNSLVKQWQMESCVFPEDWERCIEQSGTGGNSNGFYSGKTAIGDGLGQTFEFYHNVLSKLWLKLSRVGPVDSDADTLVVSLYLADSNVPTGDPIATSTVATNTIPDDTEPSYVEFAFGDLGVIIASGVYTITIEQYGANSVYWHYTDDNFIRDYDPCVKSGTWAIDDSVAGMDYKFQWFTNNDPGVVVIPDPDDPPVPLLTQPLAQTFAWDRPNMWYCGVELSKVGTPANDVTITVVGLDADGLPDVTTVIATGTIDKDTITSQAMYYAYLDSDADPGSRPLTPADVPALNPGHYALILSSAGTPDNCVCWHKSSTTNPYSDGSVATFDGSDWTLVSADDFVFTVRAWNADDPVVPDSGADDVIDGSDPPPISDTVSPLGQSYIVTLKNITQADLYLSRVGSRTDYAVYLTVYANVSPDDLWSGIPDLGVAAYGYAAAHTAEIYDGSWVRFNFDAAPPTALGATRVLVLTQPGADQDNYVRWHFTEEVYAPLTAGVASIYDDNVWRIVDPPRTRAYQVYGQQDYLPPQTDSTTTFDLNELELTVDTVLSIIIDQSGSTVGTDPDGLRYTAAAAFVTSVLTAYPAMKIDVIGLSGGTELVSGLSYYTPGVYAALGASANMSDDITTICAAIERLKTLSGGGTPLHSAIRVAANRLREQDIAGGVTYGKQKSIIVLTDGLDNSSDTTQADVIAYLQSPTDPIQTFTVGFGVELLSPADLALQAQILYDYAISTGARYYEAVDTTYVDDILDNIKAQSTWGEATYESAIQDLGVEAWIVSVQVNATVPAGTSARFDLYVSDDQHIWTVAAENRVVNIPITVKRITRYLKYVLHLTAGSSPTVHDADIAYQPLINEYYYHRKVATPRNLQEVFIAFNSTALPEGSRWSFGVAEARQMYWSDMIKIPANYRYDVAPRRNEPLTSVDNTTYLAPRGAWIGEYAIEVRSNNIVIPRASYVVAPQAGTVTFLAPRLNAESVTLTLTPPLHFRVGFEIAYPAGECPRYNDMAFTWSLRA